MFRGENTRLVWARRDTRWDVYPEREPLVLAAQNWQGTWLPQPDGTWYLSPVTYIVSSDAHTPDLRGEWVHVEITARCHLAEYRRAEMVV